MHTRSAFTPLAAADFAAAFPESRKVDCDGPAGVRVPMREIVLSNGETLRVYDSSGPHGHDVREGLPKLRESWVALRLAPLAQGRPPRSGQGACVTQLHYARKGEITPEMEFIAI